MGRTGSGTVASAREVSPRRTAGERAYGTRERDVSGLFPPRVSVDRVRVDNIRIPEFEDTREDVDDFFRKFERIARDQQWPEESWAVLKEKALQLYHNVDDGVAADYPQLKTALLDKFSLCSDHSLTTSRGYILLNIGVLQTSVCVVYLFPINQNRAERNV